LSRQDQSAAAPSTINAIVITGIYTEADFVGRIARGWPASA
jgi:hypothetical protein